jgi:hypothetical protein
MMFIQLWTLVLHIKERDYAYEWLADKDFEEPQGAYYPGKHLEELR